MQRLTTIIATGAAAAVVGTAVSLAVPALADGSGHPASSSYQPNSAVASADSGPALSSRSSIGTTLGAPNTAGTPSATPKPLTATQQQAIQQFLSDHPRLAQALAAKAATWEKFAAANPGLVDELAKVRELPPGQRLAELRDYFTSHPDQRAALRAFRVEAREAAQQQRAARQSARQTQQSDRQARRQARQDARQQARQERREQRRERRQERRQQGQAGGSQGQTGGGQTQGSASTPTAPSSQEGPISTT